MFKPNDSECKGPCIVISFTCLNVYLATHMSHNNSKSYFVVNRSQWYEWWNDFQHFFIYIFYLSRCMRVREFTYVMFYLMDDTSNLYVEKTAPVLQSCQDNGKPDTLQPMGKLRRKVDQIEMLYCAWSFTMNHIFKNVYYIYIYICQFPRFAWRHRWTVVTSQCRKNRPWRQWRNQRSMVLFLAELGVQYTK